MRPLVRIMLTLVMLTAPAGALLAAGTDSASPYNSNPQCLERDTSTATNCVVNDGPPPRRFVRRFRQEVVNGPQEAANPRGNVTKPVPPAAPEKR